MSKTSQSTPSPLTITSFEGVDLKGVAQKYGTPIFLVSQERLIANTKRMKSVFLNHYPDVAVAYSYKTNYLPAICKIICNAGAWSEIVSGFELDIAKKIGARMDETIFNGPGKTDKELEDSIEANVAYINVDSISEISRIKRIAKRKNRRVKVGLRLSSTVLYGSPWKKKFGLTDFENQITTACNSIKGDNFIELVGLHSHIATQVCDAEAHANLARSLIRTMRRLKSTVNSFEFLDIGGGFPECGLQSSSQLSEQKILGIEHYARKISESILDECEKTGINPPRLIIEPGRYIVGDAAVLLVRVIASKKQGEGDNWLIVDGGVNVLAELPDLKRNIAFVGKKRRRTAEYNIGGPLCLSDDVLDLGVKLPISKEGTLLLINDAGAYSISLSLQFIKPRPPVALVHNSKIQIIRRAETFDDMLKLDIW